MVSKNQQLFWDPKFVWRFVSNHQGIHQESSFRTAFLSKYCCHFGRFYFLGKKMFIFFNTHYNFARQIQWKIKRQISMQVGTRIFFMQNLFLAWRVVSLRRTKHHFKPLFLIIKSAILNLCYCFHQGGSQPVHLLGR